MVDGPSKQIAATLDMVMSRSLARDNSLVFHLDDFVLGETSEKQLLKKKFKGYLKLLERSASRHLQFGQQVTPRATDDGKQCRVLKMGWAVGLRVVRLVHGRRSWL